MKTTKGIKDRGILQTIRWLTLAEACLYSRRSNNTLKKLIRENQIYGTKKGGEWIVDRESIDAFYNADRDEMRIKLHARVL